MSRLISSNTMLQIFTLSTLFSLAFCHPLLATSQDSTITCQTRFTGLNCTQTADCLSTAGHAVCYHHKCRCKLGFIWCPERRLCIPKTCHTNYECYNVYGTSMCLGNGCTCTFGFRLEPISQECHFGGFLHFNTTIFFTILLAIIVLSWAMLPGLIVLLKGKPKRRSKAKKTPKEEPQQTQSTPPPPAVLQTQRSTNPFETETESDESEPSTTRSIEPGIHVPNNTPNQTDIEIAAQETPDDINNPFNVAEHEDEQQQWRAADSVSLTDAERLLFEISRDLLNELNATTATSHNATTLAQSSVLNLLSSNDAQLMPVEYSLGQQHRSSEYSGTSQSSQATTAAPSTTSSLVQTSRNASTSSPFSSLITAANFSRLNSQSSNSNSTRSSCIDSLYHPPPPYTPPSSPVQIDIAHTGRETSSQSDDLLANVPTDLLSQAVLDEVLSSSPISSSSTPGRLHRQNSRLNLSSNNLVVLAGPIPEEEPEIVGPICQPPPPYFKRCDNSLDTGNLPEPCTSRAAVRQIIEEENASRKACQEGELKEDEEDTESADQAVDAFDYMRSLNRAKVALI